MNAKNKTLEQIFDLTAVRILVNTVKDCYAALGIVHTMFKPMPGRFKDYIAMPKPNMYQSLHSTVIGPGGKPFEIQIRTFEMHKTAEYGIAAHWKYKEGINGTDKTDFKLTWLREILEWQRQTSDAEEFMEGFKIDLFSDEVFVFTPKGTVINLPNEATPIDFAYKIHTDIGNKCVGAKVNGKMVPLDYHLKTGEIVEILTSAVPKGPSIDWLNIVKSNQAKSKIRDWFKKAKKEENIIKGKDVLEKETKRQGYNFGELIKNELLNQVFKRYHLNTIDDLYAAIGTGDIIASALLKYIKDQGGVKDAQNGNNADWKAFSDNINKNVKNQKKKDSVPGIIVKGESNLLIRFAKCCNPVPGDEIVGYVTKGRGVSIHRKDCKNFERLMQNSDNKVIEVKWGKPKGVDYIAEIQIKADDRDGLLSSIMELLSETKTHVYAIGAKSVKDGIAIINIKLKIPDVEYLKNLMKTLRKLDGVIEVYRTKN